MPSLNIVILAGHLTRDPELSHTPKGVPVAALSLAVNESFKASDGTVRETVVYVDVETWGRQAETCKQYLAKGRPVLIEGRLKLDQWETQEGEKRRKLCVRADRVQFLGSAPAASSSVNTPSSRPAAPAGAAGEDNIPF